MTPAPVPKEARILNGLDRAARKREQCRHCGDIGQVVVTLRRERLMYHFRTDRFGREVRAPCAMLAERSEPAGEYDVEEFGPCPFCELGFDEEYPHESATRPPWGKDGFWRDHDAGALRPLYPSGLTPLPRGENARRLRELTERLAVAGREWA